MKVKKSISLLVVGIVLLIRSVSDASPTITSVSGAFTNGSTIVINGSNFGSGPNVVFFTDFEQGNDGDFIKSGSAGAEVGVVNAVAGTAKYTTSTSVSGSRSFQTPMAAGWGGVQVTLPVDTTDVYVSYWTYMPASDQWPGQYDNPAEAINWKIVWILGADSNGDPSTGINDKVIPTLLGYDDGTGMNYMVTGNATDEPPPSTYRYSKYLDLNIIKGQWIRFACWLKGDSVNGAMRFWQTNPLGTLLKADDSGKNTMGVGGTRRFVNINGYGRETTSSHPTFDDVYIATGPQAQARIEIGDASTYSACKKLTVATPTQWAAGQITANFWSGWVSNSSAKNLYLYVSDSSGNISVGKRISLAPQFNSIKIQR